MGSLKELIHDPAKKLKDLFDTARAKVVVFVEAAELDIIEAAGTDLAINEIKRQVQEYYEQGHEIALHIHPQWYNAHCREGIWELDYSEYNLCELPKTRIAEMVGRSTSYLRSVLAETEFTPHSFRAGNWLFQPTATAANVLADHGIRIDSSVFKGGLQHQYKLDYRYAADNGYYWKFRDDVNTPTLNGALLEIPIYTRMVPFWKMATGKRIDLQKKSPSSRRSLGQRLNRLRDLVRFQHPLKFDFCRMTLNELTSMMEGVIREDRQDPTKLRPVVAIGHTKDLVDFSTIESFLSYLRQSRISISTLEEVYKRYNL